MNKHLIWVKAKCDNYYRFINKVQYLNIKIYQIKFTNNNIYLKIVNDDIEKLQKFLVSYKFIKVKDLGIFNIIKKVKENIVFFLLFIGAFVLYFLTTNLIVEINIIHENKEIRELINDELEEHGIKILTFKKSYKEIEKIKKDILDKYPDKIDWLEIEEHGMSYDVKIEERIITDTTKDDKICDLVAKKNGLISNIKLFAGEVVVDLNDYVRKGDTLITGRIMYNNEEKRSICASGEVYANVWYTVNVSIPFNQDEYLKTGKKKNNIVYEINGNKKRIFKKKYENYESKYKTLLKIFDFKIYLETEYETKKKTVKYNEAEVLQMALDKAKDNINKKIGSKDHIIEQKVLKKSINNSKMDVEIFLVVEELISEEKIIDSFEDSQGVE